MNRKLYPIILSLIAAAVMAACGDSAPEMTAGNPDQDVRADSKSSAPTHTVKPRGPVQIGYRIIGTPVVGQPVAIELEIVSTLGSEPMALSFQINDSTSLQFPEGQDESVAMAAMQADSPQYHQVRVIPLREGRLYLNVSARVESDEGSLSTVLAVPIEVGAAPQRAAIANTGQATDENGEAIRVLQAN